MRVGCIQFFCAGVAVFNQVRPCGWCRASDFSIERFKFWTLKKKIFPSVGVAQRWSFHSVNSMGTVQPLSSKAWGDFWWKFHNCSIRGNSQLNTTVCVWRLVRDVSQLSLFLYRYWYFFGCLSSRLWATPRPVTLSPRECWRLCLAVAVHWFVLRRFELVWLHPMHWGRWWLRPNVPCSRLHSWERTLALSSATSPEKKLFWAVFAAVRRRSIPTSQSTGCGGLVQS